MVRWLIASSSEAPLARCRIGRGELLWRRHARNILINAIPERAPPVPGIRREAIAHSVSPVNDPPTLPWQAPTGPARFPKTAQPLRTSKRYRRKTS
jgi:hypothetical protein